MVIDFIGLLPSIALFSITIARIVIGSTLSCNVLSCLGSLDPLSDSPARWGEAFLVWLTPKRRILAGLVKFLAGWLRVKRNRPATIPFLERLRAQLLTAEPTARVFPGFLSKQSGSVPEFPAIKLCESLQRHYLYHGYFARMEDDEDLCAQALGVWRTCELLSTRLS